MSYASWRSFPAEQVASPMATSASMAAQQYALEAAAAAHAKALEEYAQLHPAAAGGSRFSNALPTDPALCVSSR
eukprot:2147471-Pyramimonas_sp.AAC.1